MPDIGTPFFNILLRNSSDHCTLYRAHVLSLLKLESYAGHKNGGQKGRWTEGMHDKMDAGEKGCMTEGMHEIRDARQKGCTTEGMRDIRDAWPEGNQGMHA